MVGWLDWVLHCLLNPHTDALGQLLSEYSKRVYSSQLQHLMDIAGTLASEGAEDAAEVAKLRSALESADHKRRKILQQIRSDAALLTLEDGGPPIQNPSTAGEDARLASLISLDAILKQIKDLIRQSSVSTLSKSKKKLMLASLNELAERMPSLLGIDHPCAQRQIADARRLIQKTNFFKNNCMLANHLQILGGLILKPMWRSGMSCSSIQARQPHLSSSVGQTQIQNWSLKQMPRFKTVCSGKYELGGDETCILPTP